MWIFQETFVLTVQCSNMGSDNLTRSDIAWEHGRRTRLAQGRQHKPTMAHQSGHAVAS